MPPELGLCAVCRGPVDGPYPKCYPCHQHHRASGGAIADAVVPIAYGIKGEQHYQNLVAYKAIRPATSAQTRLRDLTLLHLHDHWGCLADAARGELTGLVIVPSTRGRTGRHPLHDLLASHIPLPLILTEPNLTYSADDRDFHRDRFHIATPLPTTGRQPRVLVLDDTWTTGGRVQSMAHALKRAGASAVVAVVIGRLIKHEYRPSRDLLARVQRMPFDVTHCALPNCRRRRESVG